MTAATGLFPREPARAWGRVPQELSARVPAERRGPGLDRDAVRLLVSRGTEVSHHVFGELPLLSATLPVSSTGAKVRYWLVYFAPRKVQVAMLGGASVAEDLIAVSPRNVPKRLSATISAHRSVAQYGQYSAPS